MVGAPGTHPWVMLLPVLPTMLVLGTACTGTWVHVVPGDPTATWMLTVEGRARCLHPLWKTLVLNPPQPCSELPFSTMLQEGPCVLHLRNRGMVVSGLVSLR